LVEIGEFAKKRSMPCLTLGDGEKPMPLFLEYMGKSVAMAKISAFK